VGECFFWYRLTRVVPDKGRKTVVVVVVVSSGGGGGCVGGGGEHASKNAHSKIVRFSQRF